MHLKNLQRILKYTVKETSADTVIDTLYQKTKSIIEQYITQRDVENFIAYLKYLAETNGHEEVFKLEPDLVQEYANRIYGQDDHKTRYYRTKNLYSYFEKSLGKNAVLDSTELSVILEKLKKDQRSSIEKVMMRVCVAMILKWFQGFLKSKLSEDLQHYVAFLASVYGLYGTKNLFNVEWQPYVLSAADAKIINDEYEFFEQSLIEAIKRVNKAMLKGTFPVNTKEQFQIVFSSIDNLMTMDRDKHSDSAIAFTDKVIISTALIYLQDDFVEKNQELSKLISLFLSFYYQFRDKRYIPVFKDGMSVYRIP